MPGSQQCKKMKWETEEQCLHMLEIFSVPIWRGRWYWCKQCKAYHVTTKPLPVKNPKRKTNRKRQ